MGKTISLHLDGANLYIRLVEADQGPAVAVGMRRDRSEFGLVLTYEEAGMLSTRLKQYVKYCGRARTEGIEAAELPRGE